MELTIFKRTTSGSEKKKIRLQKDIPAIIYGKGKNNETVYVKGSEFDEILRKIKKGSISTIVFTLKEGSHKYKALIKEIQYHRTTYAIEHIDFIVLDDKVPVQVKVPIDYTGVNDCPGIKLGGVLRRVIRTLTVKCLPKDIPQEFYIDVSSLNMEDSKRLSDIVIPANVKPIGQLKEVAVAISKR